MMPVAEVTSCLGFWHSIVLTGVWDFSSLSRLIFLTSCQQALNLLTGP